MSWDTDLTGTHLEIALSDALRVRVMAGPGTGKTFAMKRRIAKWIEVDHVNPSRILAVTFTRTAASDLKRELHAMNIPGCESIHAGTLHSFCFRMLLNNDIFDFVDRVPRGLHSVMKSKIYRFEIEPLIADVGARGDFGGKRAISKRILAFEAAWARLQHEQPGWPTDPSDKAFQLYLLAWLRFHEGMLIGELVPEALRYLRNNAASPVFQQYDHVVVDEYQDLNRAEQELIDLLATHLSLSVVGDVDQSIYRFRHAHPEGIIDFADRNEGTVDFQLKLCKRCRERIVRVADTVISNNYPPGQEPRLLPVHPQIGPAIMKVLQWPTISDEAEGIAAFIEHLVNNKGFRAGDILVLSPRRLIANEIKNRLAALDSSIGVHSFYNDKLLESDEVQLAITKLQLACEPLDRVSLRFWLGYGDDRWQQKPYSTLRNYCEQTDTSPSAALAAVAGGELDLAGIDALTARYQELQSELDRIGQLDVDSLFEDLFPTGVGWAEPIRELLASRMDEAEDAEDLRDLLITELTQPEMPAEGDYVRIMSLHKSKGLTSKVTIIVGCVQGLAPFVDRDASVDEQAAQMQEQRRLFYVALTRAVEVLVLSSFASIPRVLGHQLGADINGGNHEIGKTVACPFMHELGPSAPPSVLGADWISSDFT